MPRFKKHRVVDIIGSLESYHAQIDVFDPWVDKAQAKHEYGITPIDTPAEGEYDAIVLAVAHEEFVAMGVDKIRALGKPNAILYDVKSLLPKDQVDGRL